MLDNSLSGCNKRFNQICTERSTTTWKLVKQHQPCFLHLFSEIGDEALSMGSSTCIRRYLLVALLGQHSYLNTEGFALMNNSTPKL